MVKPALLSTIASLSFLVLGYDFATYRYGWPLIAENTGSGARHLTILVAVHHFAAILSATAAGVCADFIGRRYPLAAAGALFCVGNVFKCCATRSYGILLSGQLFAGLGAGVALTVAPLYIAEQAPYSRRGQYTSLPEMWRNVGVLVGYLIFNKLALTTPNRIAQTWFFVIPIVPSILLTIAMVVMPESPHWLIIARMRVDEAKLIMERGEKSAAEIDRIGFQMEYLADHVPSLRFVWKDLVRPPLRHIVTSIALVQALRHLGVDAYLKLESLLTLYQVEEKLLTKANGAVLLVKAICSMISGRVADKAGSRFLLQVSTVLTVLFLVGFGLPLVGMHNNGGAPRQVYGGSNKVLSLVAFGGVMGSFQLGLGPMTWVYTTEVFQYRARAQGVSFGVVVGQIVEVIMYAVFPHLFWPPLYIGGAYLILAGVMVVGFVFSWRLVKDKVGEILW
ncbi:unnamed protein product [Linum tenue]|uniref:Major facilitator superfamily (MFS) profile domain-containing protein n=1 Tax=Linum tenue TaxID=586396 RepID=A0AAV0JTC8_9ROSI|nr:unnamed protein product [Linum tenue]